MHCTVFVAPHSRLTMLHPSHHFFWHSRAMTLNAQFHGAAAKSVEFDSVFCSKLLIR
jgi:hypothetical protein